VLGSGLKNHDCTSEKEKCSERGICRNNRRANGLFCKLTSAWPVGTDPHRRRRREAACRGVGRLLPQPAEGEPDRGRGQSAGERSGRRALLSYLCWSIDPGSFRGGFMRLTFRSHESRGRLKGTHQVDSQVQCACVPQVGASGSRGESMW
jgi:hypothetical protein